MTGGDSAAEDRHFMRRAMRLARLGMGRTHPNPRVGAVAVRGGRAIAMGAHLEYGGPHAEAQLIAGAPRDSLRGATLYVTLEPCTNQGKQPPCAPAVVAAGFRRVVVGLTDPNPEVCGRGLRLLQKAGLEVSQGVLEGAARRQNAPFIWRHELGRACFTLKVAASVDGRLAAADGSSRWITAARARELVHRWRASCDAVLVGRGTFMADRPRLTARPKRDPLQRLRSRLGGDYPVQPTRVVLDSRGRIAQEDALVEHLGGPGGPWIVACGARAPEQTRSRLERVGARCWVLPKQKGAGVDLMALGRRMAAEGLLDVMVEGGAGLASELISHGLVDRFRIWLAPLVLGGGHTWAADVGVGDLGAAHGLERLRARRLGKDILVEAWSRPAAGRLRARRGGGPEEA